MARQGSSFFQRRNVERSRRLWTDLARSAEALDDRSLDRLEHQAGMLRRQLDVVAVAAESRAFQPRDGDGIDRPEQCDWAWRPEPWQKPRRPKGEVSVASPYRLAEGITLFHDCTASELTVRQIRNVAGAAPAPYGLKLDVYRFDGSFLSLVFDLPDPAVKGLGRDSILVLKARLRREQPIEIFGRLNVQHGPNTEQMVRQMAFDGDAGLVEFDMAYSDINERRIEKAWIDLIFENPQMNQITLRDLTMTRAPRADL